MKSKFMIESYQDVTRKPYSFLLVDLKLNTDDRLLLIGDYMSEN